MRNKLLLVLVIGLGSCAVNQKIDYRRFRVDAKQVKTSSIDLALLDHRDAVVSRKKDPTFVGYMRSGAGIPYTIKTKSNQDFMEDLGNGMIESLKLQDIQASKIPTKWNDTEDNVRNKLLLGSGNKKLFFVIHELHTDGYGQQNLLYDIDLYVYNRSGSLLRNKSFKGDTKLGGTAMWGPGNYKMYSPDLVSKFFDHIINDTEIIEAINSN